MMKCGLYVHIPFCRNKCDYCNFFSVRIDPRDIKSIISDYYDRLISETRQRLPGCTGTENELLVDTIYFGGGTPSLLTSDQVNGLISVFKELVPVCMDAEVTLEMNPEDCTSSNLVEMVDAGVNRIVLGAQTLDAEYARKIGRSGGACTKGHLETFFSHTGYTQCVDCIIGHPGQKRQDCVSDIDLFTDYRPHHVSAYLLSVEEGTPLAARYAKTTEEDEEHYYIIKRISERMGSLGYSRYEISNYALPGYESRHNLKYWRFDPYCGIGAGAHSFLQGERFYNSMKPDEYINSEETLLSHDQRPLSAAAAEYIMTGLRLTTGISTADLETSLKFNLPPSIIERIHDLNMRELIVLDESMNDMRIRLTPKGFTLANAVVYELIESLL